MSEQNEEFPPLELVGWNESFQQLQNDIFENQDHQDKFNKEILENQQKLLGKLLSVENQLGQLKEQKTVIQDVETVATIDSKPSKCIKIPLLSTEQFVLRHIFKNVSKMVAEMDNNSQIEDYFGIKWFICVRKENEKFSIHLKCQKPEGVKLWSIQSEFEFKVIHPNGTVYSRATTAEFAENAGWAEFLKWEELVEDYVMDDELKVEAHVRINNITGIYKENLRCFDESVKELSDIILIVNDEKFHVAKLLLSTHSSYFKAMFLGMFGDSEKSEITLTGLSAHDFQKYLEVLYGEYAIDECTVEGILLVADMYDTQIVVRKCEEFLLKESMKTLKKKLQMAFRYNLENLKKKGLSEIRNVADIRSVTPVDIEDMDPSLIALLFQKSISF